MAEERASLMIAEPGDFSGEKDDSGDYEQSPEIGFQPQLECVRPVAREQGPDDRLHEGPHFVKSSDDHEFLRWTRARAEKDHNFAAEIQAICGQQAEQKRLSALVHVEAAPDPVSHKKGREVMLAATRLDPTIIAPLSPSLGLGRTTTPLRSPLRLRIARMRLHRPH
ncbi:hypothetical protein B0H19DRAFT_1247337 [Mycena capillaripes]|nr:hypothetical protein B0H19DRAFT_1247337 [Mycena capillaripes]